MSGRKIRSILNLQILNFLCLFSGNGQSSADGKRIVNFQFKASQPVPTPTFAPTTFTTTTTTTSTQQANPSLATSLQPSDPNRDIIRSFEEKQRLLEEQIRILVARQREHEELIRHHQNLQEQLTNQKNEQQRQHLEEQRRRQRFEQEQQQIQRQQQEQQQIQRQQQAQAQAQVAQQPQAQALVAPQSSSSVSVQFIPSVQIGHTVGISVEQQPPFKDAIEFHPENPNFQKNIQRFQFRQFQQQQQRNNAVFGQAQQSQAPQQQALVQQVEVQQVPAASPLPTSLELPVRNAASFNQQVSVLPSTLELPQKQVQQFQQTQNILPSLTDIVAPSQTRPRVFRNDAQQTGNFGFNNNNNVQIQQHQVRAVDNSFDNQLFNQFLQHGINQRSTDDFRLISKILAYNHGTNQPQQNALFANNQG